MVKCPHCGRTVTEHERYCYHCEQDVGKAVDEAERPRLPKPKTYNLKKDIKDYSSLVKKILRKSEKEKEIKISAYCVKCKKKVYVKNPKEYIMKNDRVAVKGSCPDCSTKVFRILGKK